MAETDVREILRGANIDGNTLSIDAVLTRPQYVAVNKVLEAAGGKWNRKAKAHVFGSDAHAALEAFLNGAEAPKPARTAEGYVATPDALADRIVGEFTHVADLTVEHCVLEPSAGDGALVRAVRRANPDVLIDAVEPNAKRLNSVIEKVLFRHEMTFEDFFAISDGTEYEAVVMNPPFAVPGKPTLWIDHVRLAFDLLADGGRLTSIAPSGILFRKDRKHVEMRELIDAHGGVKELPDDAFVASGTSVQTVVLWLDKV